MHQLLEELQQRSLSIYLVIKEWSTRKHITDLAIIAKELQQQHNELREQNALQKMAMKNQARPLFENPEVGFDGNSGVSLLIRNSGHWTFVEGVKFDNTDIEFQVFVYKVVEHNGSLSFTGKLRKKPFQNSYYNILIYHSDPYANKYLTEIHGTGHNVESFNTFDEFETL